MSSEKWMDMGQAPKDGRIIKVREENFFKFKLYKQSSTQFKSGTKGRWQKMNDHGGWDNCKEPFGDWSFIKKYEEAQ